MEILSIFRVTDFKTLEEFEDAYEGSGQEAITYLRKQYPRHTKFVLEGFEINGNFTPIKL